MIWHKSLPSVAESITLFLSRIPYDACSPIVLLFEPFLKITDFFLNYFPLFVVWNPIILLPLNWTVCYGLSFTLFLSWKFSVTRFFQKPSPPRLRLTSLKIDFQLGVHILRKYRYAMRQYSTGTVHRRLRAVFFYSAMPDCWQRLLIRSRGGFSK